MPFAHATCIVTRPETRAHGAWLREFWLTNDHMDWVEVDYGARETPRTRPYELPRVLVFRGRVGELLAQEFAPDFPDADDLLAMQRDVDALRAGEDETTWSAQRRADIARRQEALEDALYASEFPLGVTLVLLSQDTADELGRDFHALNLPRGRLVDATGAPTASARPAE